MAKYLSPIYYHLLGVVIPIVMYFFGLRDYYKNVDLTAMALPLMTFFVLCVCIGIGVIVSWRKVFREASSAGAGMLRRVGRTSQIIDYAIITVFGVAIFADAMGLFKNTIPLIALSGEGGYCLTLMIGLIILQKQMNKGLTWEDLGCKV